MKNVYRFLCKVPVIRIRFKRNLKFIVMFTENTQIYISRKSAQ